MQEPVWAYHAAVRASAFLLKRLYAEWRSRKGNNSISRNAPNMTSPTDFISVGLVFDLRERRVQQIARIHAERVSDIIEYFQRKGTDDIRGFNGTQM